MLNRGLQQYKLNAGFNNWTLLSSTLKDISQRITQRYLLKVSLKDISQRCLLKISLKELLKDIF